MKTSNACLFAAVLTAASLPVLSQQPTVDAQAEVDTIAVDPLAPEPALEAAVQKSGSRLIEEIVVTAQKREQNLQDVPISVSAFSGDMLEARGVDDPSALSLVTPGLVYSSLLGYSLIYIRGVGSDAFQPTADQSVATYIDGVYLPFGHGLAQNFVKLERLEVLKGPQGTLFGRNAVGGAINIITRKPSDTFEVELEGGLGNYNNREAKAFVSGPIAGSLYGSLSGIYTKVDSYYRLDPDSATTSLAPDETKGVNGRLQWDFAEDWSATASALITRFHGAGAVVNSAENVKPLGLLIGVQERGVRQASLDFGPLLEADNDLYYGQLGWTPEWLDIKLLGSHQEVHTNTQYDFDASPSNVVAFEVPDQFSKTTTAELQFLSKKDGLLPDWAEITSGLYFYDSNAGYADTRLAVAAPERLDALPVPAPLQDVIGVLQPSIDAFRALLDQVSAQTGLGLPTDFVSLNLIGRVETRAYAAYLQSTFYLTDWFNLTLGGRSQDEKRGVRDVTANLNTNQGPVPLIRFAEDTTTRQSFSPKISLNFPTTESQLVYLTASKTEKSGTYNLPAIYTPIRYVKPEKITAFEFGNKGAFFGGSMRYSTAAFLSEIDDLQTQIVSLASGGAQNLINAGKTQIYGVDADLTWQMFPDALPGFVLTAAGTYLKGNYDSFVNGAGYDQNTGLFFGVGALTGSPPRDFTGNTPVRTPKWTYTVGPNFAFDTIGGTVELGLDVSYNSGFEFDTQNTAEQPSYTLVNARASYLFDAWNLRVSLYGKNLTAADYYVNRFPTDFATNSTWAADQQYGLRLNWQF